MTYKGAHVIESTIKKVSYWQFYIVRLEVDLSFGAIKFKNNQIISKERYSVCRATETDDIKFTILYFSPPLSVLLDKITSAFSFCVLSVS